MKISINLREVHHCTLLSTVNTRILLSVHKAILHLKSYSKNSEDLSHERLLSQKLFKEQWGFIPMTVPYLRSYLKNSEDLSPWLSFISEAIQRTLRIFPNDCPLSQKIFKEQPEFIHMTFLYLKKLFEEQTACSFLPSLEVCTVTCLLSLLSPTAVWAVTHTCKEWFGDTIWWYSIHLKITTNESSLNNLTLFLNEFSASRGFENWS